MAVQHFETERPQSAADMLKGGYEVANAGYAAQQKQLMNQLMAKHIGVDGEGIGSFNEKGFYQDAAKAGLDHEHYNMAMQWRAGQQAAKGTVLDLRNKENTLNVNPREETRNQAGYGAPSTSLIVRPDSNTQKSLLDERPDTSQASNNPLAAAAPPAAVTQPAAATTGLSDTTKQLSPAMKSWWDKLKGNAVSSSKEDHETQQALPGNKATTNFGTAAKLAEFLGMPKQPVAPQVAMQEPAMPEQPVAPQPDAQQVNVTANTGFQSKGEEAKLTLPPVPDTVYQQQIPEDNRSAMQRYEDSVKPVDYDAIAAAATSKIVEPKADLFTWAPADDGSNKFKLYKQTLDTKLKSAGYVDVKGNPDAGLYLKTVYDNTLNSALPAPVARNAYPPTFEGTAKFNEAVQNYTTAVQQAQGKAHTAVMDARLALSKESSERGTQYFTEDTNALAHDTNRMARKAQDLAFEQVTAPGISGHLPNPAFRASASDASAAAQSTVDLMKNMPGPNTAEWLPFKMLVAKNVIKMYNLPIGEGLLNEVNGMVQNGASQADVLAKFKDGGLQDAAANEAAQLIGQFAGLNDPSGVRYLAKHGMDFSHYMYGAYGKGKEFDKYFPTLGGEAEKKAPPSAKERSKAVADAVAERAKSKAAENAKLGSHSNPYLEGVEPPIGSYYRFKGKILRRNN